MSALENLTPVTLDTVFKNFYLFNRYYSSEHGFIFYLYLKYHKLLENRLTLFLPFWKFSFYALLEILEPNPFLTTL